MATTQEIVGKLNEIKSARAHLKDVAEQCAATPITEAAPSGLYEDEIAAAIWLKELRRTCAVSAANLVETQKQLEMQAKIAPKTEHLVQEGDTPERLSMIYYGTPHDWPKILERNKLNTTDLTMGQILIIPE